MGAERTDRHGRALVLVVAVLGAFGIGLGAEAVLPEGSLMQRVAPGHNPLAPGADSTMCESGLEHNAMAPEKRSAYIADCMQRIRVVRALGPEMARLSSLHLLIPEFHDEQRFAVSGTAFGPKAMIFASPFLAGFQYAGQVAEHGARGLLAAVIHVDSASTRGLTPYTRLGLRGGINCLFIAYDEPDRALRDAGPRDAATGTTRDRARWVAYVSHIKDEKQTCAESTDPVPLAVRATKFAGFTADDIAPAARFTWDTTMTPLLGIKCLDAWCDIGPQDARRLPTFTPLRLAVAVDELSDIREAVIPAWHDEQILANYDANGKAVPGRVRATLIPLTPRYAMPKEFEASEGVPAAILWLHDDPAGTPYGTPGWGLVRGRNEIHLNSSTGKWSARVNAAGASRTWSNVHHHFHADAAVLPTARFRWFSRDDGVWISCGQACCWMDGLL